jgi:hypothetical protein
MTYCPNPDAVFTDMEDEESVLLNLRTRMYFSLNETGTLIWKHVQEESPVDAIAAALERTYDVGREAALQHVTAFLDELDQDGLVEKR